MATYDKEYRIAQLLAKEVTETLTPEERQELELWHNEHPSAQALHGKVLDLSNKSKRDEFIRELDVNHSWKNLKQQITAKSSPKKHSFLWISGIAAGILLIIGIGLTITNFNESVNQPNTIAEVHTGSPKAVFITPEGKHINLTPQDSVQTLELADGLLAVNQGNIVTYPGSNDLNTNINKHNTISVPRGGEYELILPDGTHVWINSDSELSFPVQFDKSKREVILTGEAYFKVSKNQDRPFIVKTKAGIDIKVLGTQFNVQAYPNENTIETTLSQGKVSVSDGHESVVLAPDQQAIYEKNSKKMTTRDVNASLYSAWKEGLFVFENQSLESIMNTLARWYNINVFYTSPAVKNFHFTGDLQRYADFTKTLRMIEKSTAIHFVVKGNNVMIEETAQ